MMACHASNSGALVFLQNESVISSASSLDKLTSSRKVLLLPVKGKMLPELVKAQAPAIVIMACGVVYSAEFSGQAVLSV